MDERKDWNTVKTIHLAYSFNDNFYETDKWTSGVSIFREKTRKKTPMKYVAFIQNQIIHAILSDFCSALWIIIEFTSD